jgi:hypothetical protein
MNICIRTRLTKGYSTLLRMLHRKMSSLNILKYTKEYVDDDGEQVYGFWSVEFDPEADENETMTVPVHVYFLDGYKDIPLILEALEVFAFENDLITEDEFNSLAI